VTHFENSEDEGRLWATGAHRIADLKKIYGLIGQAGKHGISIATIIGQCPGISRAQRDELLSDLVMMEKVDEGTDGPGYGKKHYRRTNLSGFGHTRSALLP
jgi:hypothetical protein